MPIQGLQSFVVRNGFDAKYTHALLQDLQSRMMITRLEIGGKPHNFGHHHQHLGMGRANYFWTRVGYGPVVLAMGGPWAGAFCLGPVQGANFGLFLTNF